MASTTSAPTLTAQFNPTPTIDIVTLETGAPVMVIDNALRDPEALVRHAEAHRSEFENAPFNAYPGIQLRMDEDFTQRLEELFSANLRRFLDARRTLRMHTRLAMVTTKPEDLQPRQIICHRDHQELAANESIAASVLYLFRDESLGGTSFYAPVKSEQETALLVHDSSTMLKDAFLAKYGLQSRYFDDMPAYFRRIGTVPAKWNRLIFYDGGTFHSGDIRSPDKLNADPRSGRLTLNGFFTCSRRAK
jgi:hypothetical protein